MDPVEEAPAPDPSLHGIDRRRWLALAVLCMGVLMIVLDTTIVNVALPSMKQDLRFTDAGVAWVVNAYLLTFGGFLLIGGRLGDLYGPRRVFLAGLTLFTAASLACGLSPSQEMLIVARAVQGFGGAVVSAVSLSLVMALFRAPKERARAMGVYGFVAAGGGSVGVLLGGLLTNALNWHWVFLVNIPIGAAVYVLCLRLVPAGDRQESTGRIDAEGAAAVTASLMIAVYAIVNGNENGWTSAATLGLLTASAALFAAFLLIERRVRVPLIPLGLFRRRNLAIANAVGTLWAAAMFAWFFLSALYMQLVLGYTPLQIGLSFLPANVLMAFLSIAVSAKLVDRFGIRKPLAAGLLLAATGLLLFSAAPVGGQFAADILPGMLLLGLGAGVAFNPVLLAAMSDVKEDEAGLASGVVNTSFMMGGALGLAVLASVAAATSGGLLAAGLALPDALAAGYRAAFLVGAAFAGTAALLGGAMLRITNVPSHAHGPAPETT